MTTIRLRSTRSGWSKLHPGRLATAPTLRIVDREAELTHIEVEGLVCAFCAVRTEAALKTVSGVKDVHVDLRSEMAEISHAAVVPSLSALEHALDVVVVAGWARRWLARTVAMLRTGQR